MEKQQSFFLKSKQTCLRLIYEITEQIIAGNNPLAEMIKQARDAGRRVEIPEEELKNLGLLNPHLATNH
jgi:hypothetical protein